MVSLTPEIGGDKSKHLIGLAIGILAFPVLTAISLEFNRRGLNKYYYPLTAIVLAAVTYISARLFIPELYSLIGEIGTYFLREAGGLTIAEASPLLIRGGEFTLAPLWYTFGAGAIISFLVLAYLLFIAVTQKNTQEKTFLIVWSVIIIWAMLQQNRFTYYYAVNVAILCSFAGIMVLDKAGWPQLINSLKNKLSNNDTESTEPKKKKKKSKSKNISENQKLTIWHIASVLIIVLVLVYPAASLSVEQASRDIGGLNGPWIDSMHWLKYNTPDNGVDYLEIYEPRPEDADYYPYPEEAYGVMSWWDYGHWITAIGERIPHANPFQRG
ncbi:oligosaccharyl transferase, archaeosortase A system-associated, partial [Methanosalsum natronophilum]